MYQLKHFIEPEQNPQYEKCRKLLMLSAQSDANSIVACIKSKPENSLTSLFREFSKFVLEDLARNSATEHLSKSRRKGGPGNLYGIAGEGCNNACNGKKPLNAKAREFTPRNLNSCSGFRSEGHLGVSGAANGDDFFGGLHQSHSNGTPIMSVEINAPVDNGPNATSEQWRFVEVSESPEGGNSKVIPLPSRGRSDTNPFEFDDSQSGEHSLEEVLKTAVGTYECDIGRSSLLASGVKSGSRREVGNGTSHGRDDVSDVNRKVVREDFSTEEHHVCPTWMSIWCHS